MSQFQRILSYVYAYNANQKENNVGFARFEQRGPLWKLHINVRSPQNVYAQVYALQKREESLHALFIGDMHIRNGNGVFNLKTENSHEIFDTSTICGFCISKDKSLLFASNWDDTDLIPSEIHYKDNANISEETTNTTITPDREISTDEQPAFTDEITTDEIPDTPLLHAQEISAPSPSQSTGEHLLSIFPNMYPFESDTITNCVRMELEDLSFFPMEKWVLTNNSFLLHGFYCYRHLIFCKKENETSEPTYFIGVPGIRHVRDEGFADMFGFTHFESIKDTKNSIGEFGYWLMPMWNL